MILKDGITIESKFSSAHEKINIRNISNQNSRRIFFRKNLEQFYSVDASSYQIIPKIVVIPKNEKDVINLVKIAKKFKISVTVRGAGTGLSRKCVKSAE